MAIVYLLTGGKIVAEVPQASQVMGPAFAEKSSFDVDPSWHASPARDAVVAYLPPGSDGPLLGRIVALPGDRLEVRERRLLVNGTIIKKTSRSMSDETVPEIVWILLVVNPPRGVEILTSAASRSGEKSNARISR